MIYGIIKQGFKNYKNSNALKNYQLGDLLPYAEARKSQTFTKCNYKPSQVN